MVQTGSQRRFDMRYRVVIPVLSLVLVSAAAPVRAEGRWAVGLLAGESVSTHHGSALDARALAKLDPLLAIGIETGVAYMNDTSTERAIAYPTEPGGGIGTSLSSLTDGITRNRGYYLGPAVKVGDVIYAIASTGLYEFSGNDGHFTGTRWGMSAGLGLAGRSRFAPTAEVRYRWSQDSSQSASAFLFTVGLQIQ